MSVLGHTNFAPNHDPIARGAKSFTLFSLDTCEQCDCEVQAPNAVGILETKNKLIAMGLTFRDSTPGEISYCEEVEMAVCEECLEKATADED